jgi:hypothetical protein
LGARWEQSLEGVDRETSRGELREGLALADGLLSELLWPFVNVSAVPSAAWVTETRSTVWVIFSWPELRGIFI